LTPPTIGALDGGSKGLVDALFGDLSPFIFPSRLFGALFGVFQIGFKAVLFVSLFGTSKNLVLIHCNVEG